MEKIKNIFTNVQNINQDTFIDIIIAIIIIIASILLGKILGYVVVKLFKLNKKNNEKIKENPWYYGIKNIIICFGIYVAILVMNFPDDFTNSAMKIFKIILILTAAKIAVKFLTPRSIIFKKMKASERLRKNEPLVNFVEKIAKYIVYFVAIFMIIAELGYDLSGLITGLGLGGVIVALAAQDIAKNLFGGIAIILDKPFSVGDWINTEKYEGTIEDITFRSTRIRTVDNSIVTIPNSTLSNEVITNWSKLERRRIDISLRLPLETKSDDLERITHKIKFALDNNKHILKDSTQIDVNKIKEDNIEIIIFMYTDIIEYAKFLDLKQEINISILKILESEKMKLAYPGRNVYVHK